MDADRLARIVANFQLNRGDILVNLIILRGHPELTWERALFNFVRGLGPAAAMRGRTPTRRTWRRSSGLASGLAAGICPARNAQTAA